MNEKRETKKYVFTVEGETEQWYLYWLRDQISEPLRPTAKALEVGASKEGR